ncbi:hypothetical protein [Paludisphaera rhizosphaerae]|uniref:hypothetical protein n=1 Tax=Paludisphaera rhizosphaerae TaxID=2711216 RepID=UPI0013E9D634|nr:hypothetical protein [Paludisphaera rhizosphaerae]
MSEVEQLLQKIEDGIVEHGGDLGGWTRLDGDALQLFDGRITLRAELRGGPSIGSAGMIHLHILATLHDYDDEVLDACIVGMGENREAALAQAAVIWITCVAGPIRSFLDDRPVCSSCKAGVKGGDASKGYCPGDYGLAPGLRSYVGPAISRGFTDDRATSRLDDTKPWFRFAAESAAPRRVHLAKATILAKGKAGWNRELEIDGHDVSHVDPDWPAGVRVSEVGYLTRFAVFAFPDDSPEVARQAELDRTIRRFAEDFSKYESVDPLMEDMVAQGFDPDLVHEVESLSTIAFGRLLFEPYGLQYSPTIIRARRDGRIETDVPLMGVPAYSRARAVGARLRETMPMEQFRSLCLYNAESNAIMQAMEAADGKPEFNKMKLYPSVVPDRGVDERTMDAAMAELSAFIERDRTRQKRPWWKFWKS